MLNKYPLWKYLLVLSVLCLGFFYAAPNLYKPDPALQITGENSAQLIDKGRDRADDFSWDRTAGLLWGCLSKAAEHCGLDWTETKERP